MNIPLKVLGAGEFGTVYESADGEYAKKIPFTKHQKSFRNEIKILKHINGKNHRHLIQLLDFCDDEVHPFSFFRFV